MKSVKLAVCGALSALALSAPAHAASLLFNFGAPTVSFSDLNSCGWNGACLSWQSLLPTGDVLIEEGALNAQTFDFLKFTVSPGIGGDKSFEVTADLVLDAPDANPDPANGHASYFRLGGIFTPGILTGSLDWAQNSQQVTTADGSKFTLTFGDISGFKIGGTAIVPVTITVDSVADVAAVPEPATWAMMLMGFFGLGGVLRSRRRGLALAA